MNEQRRKILDDSITHIMEKLSDAIILIVSHYIDRLVFRATDACISVDGLHSAQRVRTMS